MGRTTRRIFVGTGLSIVAVAGGSLLACSQRAETASYDRLDVLLADIRDPVRVGQDYRATYGLAALEAQADGCSHIASALRLDCPATRHALLKEGIRKEFAAREIVLCNQFVLSRTECIVAGLRLDAARAAVQAG